MESTRFNSTIILVHLRTWVQLNNNCNQLRFHYWLCGQLHLLTLGQLTDYSPKPQQSVRQWSPYSNDNEATVHESCNDLAGFTFWPQVSPIATCMKTRLSRNTKPEANNLPCHHRTLIWFVCPLIDYFNWLKIIYRINLGV